MGSNPIGTKIFSRSHARVTLFHVSHILCYHFKLSQRRERIQFTNFLEKYIFRLSITSDKNFEL